jgi:hypothetical protein
MVSSSVGCRSILFLAAHTCGKSTAGIVIVVQRKSNLLEVVGTLHSSCGFTGGLHSGQEQSNENADNGDDDEEFNEGETSG